MKIFGKVLDECFFKDSALNSEPMCPMKPQSSGISILDFLSLLKEHFLKYYLQDSLISSIKTIVVIAL